MPASWLGFVLALAASTLGFVSWRLAFILRATRVPATVVEIALGGEDGDVPAPVVEYRHPTGELRRARPLWFTAFYAARRVGDAMEVLVGHDGRRARLNTFSELWFFGVLVIAMLAISGAVFCAVLG